MKTLKSSMKSTHHKSYFSYRIWIFLFLIIVGNNLEGQNQNAIDSLEQLSHSNSDDTTKVKILNALASEYLLVDSDSVTAIIQRSLDLAASLNLTKEVVDAKLLDLENIWNQGKGKKSTMWSQKIDFSAGLRKAEECLELSRSIDYDRGVGISLLFIGRMHYKGKDYEKAIKYASESVDLFKSMEATNEEKWIKSKEYWIAMGLYRVAISYNLQRKYELAISYYEESLKYCKITNYKEKEIHCLRSLGLVYRSLGESKIAIDFHEKSLNIAKEYNYRGAIIKNLNDIAECYIKIDDIDKAILYYEKAIDNTEGYEIENHYPTVNATNFYLVRGAYNKAMKYSVDNLVACRRIGFKEGEARCLSDIGRIQENRGEYVKARKTQEESIKVYEEMGFFLGMGTSKNRIGNIYRQEELYDKALEVHSEALLIFQENNIPNKITESLNFIGDVYYDTKNYDKALEYYNKALTLVKNQNLSLHYMVKANIKISNIYRIQASKNVKFIEEALNYSDAALELSRKQKNKVLESESLQLKGRIYSLTDKQKALEYFLEALGITEKTEASLDIIPICNDIGKLFYEQGSNIKAKNYFKRSLELSDKIDYDKINFDAHIGMGKCYMKEERFEEALEEAFLVYKGKNLDTKLAAVELIVNIKKEKEDYADAVKYGDIRYQLKDSIVNLRNQAAVEGMLIDMKSVKDLEIEKRESELKSQKIKIRNYFVMIMGGLAFLFFLGLWFFRSNSKKNKLLAKNSKEIAEKNKEIADKEKEYRLNQDNLFANLSHEFRTPLTIIKTSIKEGEGLYKEMFNRNIDHLTELTNQMLDLSKLGENKMELVMESLDVSRFVIEIVQQLESFATSKNIKLSLFLPDFPNWVAKMDRTILRKILVNLIFNALKYTQKGKVDVTVFLDFSHWGVKVLDTGIGIREEHLPHVFDRYYRAPLDKGKMVTTGGLGLALTKQLVELSGGEINAESEYGKGSEFNVSFQHTSKIEHNGNIGYSKYPLSYFPKEEEHILETEELVFMANSVLGKEMEDVPLILIVEDSPDINKMLVKRMEKSFRVLNAFNGREALDILQNETPDIIITDLMMPEMNGIDFVRNLKRNQEMMNIPVIVMSALNEEFGDMELWELGIVDFVRKPFSMEVLVFKLKNHLSLSKELIDDNERLKMMSSMLIHDLRAPIRTVKSFSQLVLKEESESKRDEYLEYVITGAENLNGLINGLTEISKINKRKDYKRLKILNILDLVLYNLTEVIERTKTKVNKNIQLEEIRVNKIDLIQLLQNLIQNAAVYSRENTSHQIDLSIASKGQNLIEIIVKDNGRGIPKEEHNTIFDKFQRGTSSKGVSGTGLGMYIISEIVKKYNGKISLDSEVGIGTTFYIELTVES